MVEGYHPIPEKLIPSQKQEITRRLERREVGDTLVDNYYQAPPILQNAVARNAIAIMDGDL
jgi:hypothetical protein